MTAYLKKNSNILSLLGAKVLSPDVHYLFACAAGMSQPVEREFNGERVATSVKATTLSLWSAS